MPKQPAKKIRIGNISATIWENENQNGHTFYTVDVQRNYKDGDAWQSTNSLNAADLHNAREVLRLAATFILEQEND